MGIKQFRPAVDKADDGPCCFEVGQHLCNVSIAPWFAMVGWGARRRCYCSCLHVLARSHV